MNLPNKLSLLRVALIPVMVALMLPQTLVCDLLAAAVFAVAALTDYFDGHIARSRHLITDFGKFIDPVADKLLNLSAMMMLVQRGTLPGWVVVLILARELAVDGLRMVAVGQGRVIAAGKLGKIKTASQMVMLLFVLITHQPALTAPAWGVAYRLYLRRVYFHVYRRQYKQRGRTQCQNDGICEFPLRTGHKLQF